MRTEDAGSLLRRLAFADIRRMLRTRLAAWSATAFLAWSLAILIATVTNLSVAAFHAILMGAASFLPAFLMFPVRPNARRDAIRRIDERASVEAWLGYAGGPAGKVLGVRAFETLSVGELERWKLPTTPRKVRMAIAGISAAALVALGAAQAVSVRAGYGLVFAYPEKPSAGGRSLMADPPSDAAAGMTVPGAFAPDAEDAPPELSRRPQAGPGRRTGSPGDGDPLADPGFEPGGEKEQTNATADANAPVPSGTGLGQANQRRASTELLGGSDGQTTGGDENGAGGPDPADAARVPGWEGSGRALEASPIIDYRARFERQFTDATGRETVLGDDPTPAALSKAIAAYYESFDMRVLVGQSLDPAIARLQDAWRRAFGNGDAP